jgi:hypothetical protein
MGTFMRHIPAAPFAYAQQPMTYAHVHVPPMRPAFAKTKKSRALAIIDPKTGKNIIESLMNEKNVFKNASKAKPSVNAIEIRKPPISTSEPQKLLISSGKSQKSVM